MRHHQDKSDINDELHEELNKCLEINKDHPMKCINPVKFEYEQDYDSNENVEKKYTKPDAKTTSRKKSPKKKVLKEHSSSEDSSSSDEGRVSVQGVKSLVGHFACLCLRFEFYEEKKMLLFFKKKREILLHF